MPALLTVQFRERKAISSTKVRRRPKTPPTPASASVAHRCLSTHAVLEPALHDLPYMRRSVRAVRPASLAASARLWRLQYTEYQCLSRSNSCTLRAGSKRTASMQPRTQVVQERICRARLQSSVLCGIASPPKPGMRLVFQQPPNPSIEGTASGLRPPAAPHVKR
jgi:hypothetical protein